MKIVRILLVVTFLVSLNVTSFAAAEKELRGVYMELTDSPGYGVYPVVADGDWQRFFRELKSHGINAIFPNVVSPAGAIYPSSVVSRKPLNSLQGQPDLLKVILSAARLEGLQVHAWTIEWHNAPKGTDRDRLVRDANGKTANTLCPSVKENREQMRRMILELATNYAIDGLQYDYMRFPEGGFCYCRHCREAFQKTAGVVVSEWPKDVLSGGTFEKPYLEFLYGSLNSFVREMYPLLKKANPKIAVSAAVWARDAGSRVPGVRQDWGAWVREGALDFIVPMNYGNDWILKHYADFATNEMKEVAGRMPVVFGLGAYMDTPEGLVRSVKLNRELKAAGSILYTLNSRTYKTHLPELRRTVWSTPAVAPSLAH